MHAQPFARVQKTVIAGFSLFCMKIQKTQKKQSPRKNLELVGFEKFKSLFQKKIAKINSYLSLTDGACEKLFEELRNVKGGAIEINKKTAAIRHFAENNLHSEMGEILYLCKHLWERAEYCAKKLGRGRVRKKIEKWIGESKKKEGESLEKMKKKFSRLLKMADSSMAFLWEGREDEMKCEEMGEMKRSKRELSKCNSTELLQFLRRDTEILQYRLEYLEAVAYVHFSFRKEYLGELDDSCDVPKRWEETVPSHHLREAMACKGDLEKSMEKVLKNIRRIEKRVGKDGEGREVGKLARTLEKNMKRTKKILEEKFGEVRELERRVRQKIVEILEKREGKE